MSNLWLIIFGVLLLKFSNVHGTEQSVWLANQSYKWLIGILGPESLLFRCRGVVIEPGIFVTNEVCLKNKDVHRQYYHYNQNTKIFESLKFAEELETIQNSRHITAYKYYDKKGSATKGTFKNRLGVGVAYLEGKVPKTDVISLDKQLSTKDIYSKENRNCTLFNIKINNRSFLRSTIETIPVTILNKTQLFNKYIEHYKNTKNPNAFNGDYKLKNNDNVEIFGIETIPHIKGSTGNPLFCPADNDINDYYLAGILVDDSHGFFEFISVKDYLNWITNEYKIKIGRKKTVGSYFKNTFGNVKNALFSKTKKY